MPMHVFWLRLSLDIVVWLCWIMTFPFCRTSDFKWCLDLTCSGSWLDCRGTRIFWWSWFSAWPKFEPSEDLVQVVLCSLRLLGSVVGTRFAVCLIRFTHSLFTSVMGECRHRSDLAWLLSWSCSYKDWDPQLSRDAFIYRFSMGLQYGSINLVLNQGCALGSFRLDGLLCIQLWAWFG